MCESRVPLLLLSTAVASIVLNASSCRRMLERAADSAHAMHGRGYRGNGEHTDSFRELVERSVPPDASVYYCADSDDGRLQSAERSIHLSLSWATSPRPVRFGGTNDVGDVSFVAVSRFRRVGFSDYARVAENDYAALWRRDGVRSQAQVAPVSSSPRREGIGVVVVSLLVLAAVTFLLCPCKGLTPNPGAYVCAATVFVATAALALSHTFVAPTGLGVYGGKARLLFLYGGMPPGFFTDAAYSSFQPAYPPGLALLTLAAYVLSGECGEWLTQILVVAAFAAASAVLCSQARSLAEYVFTLALMLAPCSLCIASFYYAEPFVALCILVGWLRVRERDDDCLGWLVIGLPGVFKNEGVVLTFACWLALRLIDGRRTAPVRGLVVALVLPAAWHAGCRLAGATLYDFAVPWGPDFSRARKALAFAAREAFARPWGYAFVWPLSIATSIVAAVRRDSNRKRGLFAALLVAAISTVVFAYVFSLSRAPDFAWHLHTAMPRLLWTPTMLLAFELLRPRLAVKRPPCHNSRLAVPDPCNP